MTPNFADDPKTLKRLGEKIIDLENRLVKARKFYIENQKLIERQTKIIDDVIYLCDGDGEREVQSQHHALDVVREVLHDGHKAATLAGKYRQWCRFILKAAQRPEWSHLLNDPTWELLLGGIEADLEAEAMEDREAGLPEEVPS